MIQIGSIPTAATGAGAGGPGGSASGGGGGAAASGAGATEVAPPEAAPPEEAAPPLSPCAKALPVTVKSSAPPAKIETHFRCMTFFSRCKINDTAVCILASVNSLCQRRKTAPGSQFVGDCAQGMKRSRLR